jgi:hypothetical protein
LTGLVRVVDINNRGSVLGWHFDRVTGVVIEKRGATTFTIPGATFMETDALTAGGTIAGNYFDLSDRGPFLLDKKGTLTPVIVEGDWQFVNLWDVSDNGIVVGEVIVPGQRQTFGFIQDRNGTRFVEAPGAQFTSSP